MMQQHRKQHQRASSLCRWFAAVVLTLAPATTALGQRDQSEPDPLDARLEGYDKNVTLPEAGTGLTWMAFVGLLVLVASGLFKDARRSHLD